VSRDVFEALARLGEGSAGAGLKKLALLYAGREAAGEAGKVLADLLALSSKQLEEGKVDVALTLVEMALERARSLPLTEGGRLFLEWLWRRVEDARAFPSAPPSSTLACLAILYLKSLLVDLGCRVDLGALEEPERAWGFLAG
jgi:hypothetical protein